MEEHVEWSVDTSEAAMKARMEGLSDQVSALALTSELELASKDRVDLFYKFVEVKQPFFRSPANVLLTLYQP